MSEPEIPPLETLDDTRRKPPPRRPDAPRPRIGPIRTLDDIPPAALALLAAVACLAVLLALKWGLSHGLDWGREQDWAWATQWSATITDPVHAYLRAHTVGLPVTAGTAIGIWLCVGGAALIGSWISPGFGPRLTWLCHGAATVAMVWDASPAAGRTVAAGLAVLAWTALSTLAMRGFSLRPVINVLHRS
ncbi:hypothetical protein [Streptomyces sp. NPDC046925]|uniref:hypothetical protein n=1 Tax=Streptomyces sp. NPDC046925 TaxID=3155375 RepID=UPI0033C641B1